MKKTNQHIKQLLHDAHHTARDFVVLNGIDFCSNDYLSLRGNQQIRDQVADFIAHCDSLSATGSRLVSGNYSVIQDLEQSFADLVSRPRALFFSSAYQANLSVISCMARNCHVFSDESNHASIIDGLRLTKCHRTVYRHNDLDHLESLLRISTIHSRVIITESVFSTDGSLADLEALCALAHRYDALLIVDESHATGVFGPNGAGRLSTWALKSDNVMSVHSCGKALSAAGGFVACSENVACIIKNMSRQFICTTAAPPYLAFHVLAVLQAIKKHPEYRVQLWKNITHCSGALRGMSPIKSVFIGDEQRAMAIKKIVHDASFDVAVFRYPSVKKSHAQLRITIHRHNTLAQIDQLQYHLERAL